MKKNAGFATTCWIIALFLLISGCAGEVNEESPTTLPTQPPPTASSTPTTVPPTPVPPQSPTPNNGLSSDAISTLDSLKKVDDYPFYVMKYSGEYDPLFIPPDPADVGGFGCSLFSAMGGAELLFGRNFDWDYSPSLLLYTDPPDGYASVSMVDLTFLRISNDKAKLLDTLPNDQRTELLIAPIVPFDGMNEYGLVVGMAAVPDEFADDVSYDPSKPTMYSTGMIRLVLDHARNIDEALEIFDQYNISMAGGPPIHYLLADQRGKTVLIEFYKGEMVVQPNENPWHLATNHLRCIAKGDGGCWRYHILSAELTSAKGNLDEEAAMQLLSEVTQPNTQWSTLYNYSTGKIQVAIHENYQEPYTFQLELTSR